MRPALLPGGRAAAAWLFFRRPAFGAAGVGRGHVRICALAEFGPPAVGIHGTLPEVSTRQVHRLLGTREIPAGETACLAARDSRSGTGEVAERAPDGEQAVNLLSNPVEVEAQP